MGSKSRPYECAKGEGGTCRGSSASTEQPCPSISIASSHPQGLPSIQPHPASPAGLTPLLPNIWGTRDELLGPPRTAKAGRPQQLSPFPAALPLCYFSCLVECSTWICFSPQQAPASSCLIKISLLLFSPLPAPGSPARAVAHRSPGAGTSGGRSTGWAHRAVSCPFLWLCSRRQDQTSP